MRPSTRAVGRCSQPGRSLIEGDDRHVGVGVQPADGLLAVLLADRVERAIGVEGRVRAQQLVEDRGERVDVAGGGEDAGLELLGLAVVRGADDHVDLGRVGADDGRAVPRAGQAEVEDLDLPVVLDKDVLRLDVAVDDALRVRLGEAEAGLMHDRHRLRRMQRVVEGVPGVERGALEVVHQHVDVAVGAQAAVEGADHVRVGQRAEDGDLSQRALGGVARGHRLAGQLEREGTVVAADLDLVDVGEGARPEHAQHLDVPGV
jgi:hypothetical protein